MQNEQRRGEWNFLIQPSPISRPIKISENCEWYNLPNFEAYTKCKTCRGISEKQKGRAQLRIFLERNAREEQHSSADCQNVFMWVCKKHQEPFTRHIKMCGGEWRAKANSLQSNIVPAGQSSLRSRQKEQPGSLRFNSHSWTLSVMGSVHGT